MGCTASKLDNEDTVRRCKERRRLMKDAVYARHHLAAAHSDYCRSLRVTGSALCNFAAGEPLSVSGNTPAVFLNPSPPPQTAATSAASDYHPPPRVAPSPSPSLHPPPPPPFSPSSPTIASSKLPHILSSSSIASSNHRRRKPPPKLPHILSESSPSSSPRSQASNFPSGFFPTAYQANSTYSSTPSQASSVWNWENFYPPSPPGSEYFRTRAQQPQQSMNQKIENAPSHHLDTEDFDDEDTERSEYDFFHPKHEPLQAQKLHQRQLHDQDYEPLQAQKLHQRQLHDQDYEPLQAQKLHQRQLHDQNYTETEREEVQCSEWGDHYSTTSSSDEEEEDVDSRSEIGTRSNFGSSVRAESVIGESMTTATGAPKMHKTTSKTEKPDDGGSSASYRTGDVMDMKLVVRHKDLKEIVEAIRENFEKAAMAGDEVSELLEISRAQLDRSFRQLRKTVYHSSSILSNLSSSWTSKPPLAVKYKLDTGLLEEPSGPKSLCSTLERLWAWEKKLYEEVKAREGVKIEHEKKLSALQSQEYKGEDEAKLSKTKTSIQRLQSLIIVTSQAVSTTSTAIIGLRDSDLVPQLVQLCHGIMYMWRLMHQYHEIQSNIVQQVRGLVNQSARGHSTSELHRQATRDLESAVSAWHSNFCRLMKLQRGFILSLHGWFKLSLIPVSNDNINSSKEPSDSFAFCDEWKLALDRVPDIVASEAIKSFINVVHVISVKQSEELKIKKGTETVSKELDKKASALRNIERKFYNSYSMVGIGLPAAAPDNGQGLDARDPLAEKKLELAACQRRVEDEMLRHSKAVEVTRAMTLNNLQTSLPGVFQALTGFSCLFTEVLETVCTRSYAIR